MPSPSSVRPTPTRTVPGTLTEVFATAADGTPLRAWLVLPEGASADAPAPLVLWMHGGPVNSWNAWSWRWCPWLLAARGYAVLLPDPAFSTGYGRSMVQRGWGQWGGTPYTDLMTITDVALERPDLDAERTAAMGGSYGGYLANWVAGHTDRFRAIVTHASLWALDQFAQTTDLPAFWRREWGDPDKQPERYETWSPHRFAAAITTPMLVVHGDRDYRVPIGEGAAPVGRARRARASTPSSSTSPTRTTGCSPPATPGSGTRPCSASSISTCWARSGCGPSWSETRRWGVQAPPQVTRTPHPVATTKCARA